MQSRPRAAIPLIMESKASSHEEFMRLFLAAETLLGLGGVLARGAD